MPADWHTQPAVIEGHRMTYTDLAGGRLYHGTTADLPVGTDLTPGGGQRNHRQSASDAVSITSDPRRARYWARQAADEGQPVFVYEIEPLGRIEQWRTSPAEYGAKFTLWEGRVPGARIIAVVEVG